MELVIVFAGMGALCFGVAVGSVLASERGHEVGNLTGDAVASGVGFILLSIVGLLFV